jgi:hypothetical protein
MIEQAVMKGRSKMEIDPTWEYVADNVMGGVSNGRAIAFGSCCFQVTDNAV